MSFTGLGELAALGEAVITRLFPDAESRADNLYKLEELKQKGDVAELNAFVQLMVGQLEINKEEAKSESWFKSGWRPFVGWCCGFAFVYAAILEPILRFISSVLFGYEEEFPTLDTSLTMQVLLGMLGLAGMRSWEKKEVNK